MKIASTKNAMPSSANGRPITAPYSRMNAGHSRPISKLRIVPDTAPTAKSTAATLDQRSASSSATGSRLRMPRRCTTQMTTGKATPKQARTMCDPSDTVICHRAGSSAPDSLARVSTAQPNSAQRTSEQAGQQGADHHGGVGDRALSALVEGVQAHGRQYVSR